MNADITRIDPALFQLLSEALIEEINMERLKSLYRLALHIETDDSEMAAIISEVTKIVDDIGEQGEAALLPLGIEYSNLFRGTGSETNYLYESVHRSENGLMYEGPYFSVKAMYKKSGFQEDNVTREPADHLAVECAYLAWLNKELAKADQRADLKRVELLKQQQQVFLTEHFLCWVPAFSATLLHLSQTAFYAQLASLLLRLCRSLDNDQAS